MNQSRKLILYISMSLDGFIAGPNDDLSWLSLVEEEGEDYGYKNFTDQVDTYIVGRKTYDVVRNLCNGKFPAAQQCNCYVLSRSDQQPYENITFYSGAIEKLITDLKNQKGKNIYCDGGAEIVNLLLKQNLIDEYIISIIPILLGEGIRLFKGGLPSIDLKAQPAKSFPSGLVQLHYLKEVR